MEETGNIVDNAIGRVDNHTLLTGIVEDLNFVSSHCHVVTDHLTLCEFAFAVHELVKNVRSICEDGEKPELTVLTVENSDVQPDHESIKSAILTCCLGLGTLRAAELSEKQREYLEQVENTMHVMRKAVDPLGSP